MAGCSLLHVVVVGPVVWARVFDPCATIVVAMIARAFVPVVVGASIRHVEDAHVVAVCPFDVPIVCGLAVC